MNLHVIVGAGAVGSTAAQLLAERGDRVRMVTRSGSGPSHPAIELVAADATDADRLAALAEGAVALYNCANPLYHRWLTDWPPLASSLLAAATRSGAALVTMGNLYGHGPVDEVMTAHTPLAATHPKLRLRADMWRDALARHEAGQIRAVEVRASDFLEARSVFSEALGNPLLAGRRGYVPAPLDVPHTFTSTTDAARTLVAVATDERAFGRAWLVPSNPALTVRQLADRFVAVNGAPKARLTEIPHLAVRAIGLFAPFIRELETTRYQFTSPYIMDATETTDVFALHPTPLDDVLRATAARLRAAA
ncbi:NAD-dependent epimerase/dehydratase family protein [Luedemannella flava]|uniref:NAD-dependent epimerase/dehydratase family protein n=1 Tax=Luedemannella flava TaxID=349316 RepID=A0ABN2LU04_9ACTN